MTNSADREIAKVLSLPFHYGISEGREAAKKLIAQLEESDKAVEDAIARTNAVLARIRK